MAPEDAGRVGAYGASNRIVTRERYEEILRPLALERFVDVAHARHVDRQSAGHRLEDLLVIAVAIAAVLVAAFVAAPAEVLGPDN